MIYLVKIVGMPIVKIGYSESFPERLYNINRSMPFEVESLAERNGSLSLERDIHALCKEFHMKNEWYPDVEFVRQAFFCCPDRYPGLSQKEQTLRKKQEREEYLMAFGCGKINLWGKAVPK